MKIQKVTDEHRPKVYALLQRAFPGSSYESLLIRKLHENGKELHEWVCVHVGKVIAYIAFSKAFNGTEICGLHLAPMAVAPDFQRQGIGTELLNFALRQEAIRSSSLFVLGEPDYYRKFGFEPCTVPICPFDQGNTHFLSMRNTVTTNFTVDYEPEFLAIKVPTAPPARKRRKR